MVSMGFPSSAFNLRRLVCMSATVNEHLSSSSSSASSRSTLYKIEHTCLLSDTYYNIKGPQSTSAILDDDPTTQIMQAVHTEYLTHFIQLYSYKIVFDNIS